MSGEFQKTLDQTTVLMRSVLFLITFAVYFVITAGPYILYRNFADAVTRATTKDRVWICEANRALGVGDVQDDKVTILSPFPMIDGRGTNCPAPKYYACVGSAREAEDWLLEHGYRKTLIVTATIGPYDIADEKKTKEFLVRHLPGTRTYSVVRLLIDYGDYDIREVPFAYPRGKSPIDFSRFPEEDFRVVGGDGPMRLEDIQRLKSHYDIPFPPFGSFSVLDHGGYGSHTWGRRHCSNNEAIRDFDSGRLHHKSCSHKDFFQIGFIQGGCEAFVLDAYLAC